MVAVRTQLKQSPVQVASMLVGATFLLVGILGFVPGITHNFSDLMLAGHRSDAELLGIFQVSALHNVVHLLFGVAGLAASRMSNAARTFLVGGGVVYLALWVYGVAVDHASSANFVPFNTADNWLHLGLGVAMLLLGISLGRQADGEVSPA